MQYPSLHPTGGFKALATNAGHNPTYGVYQVGFERSSPIPATFSVYVPVITTQVNLHIFKAAEALIAGAMCFNEVPDSVNLSLATWNTFPFYDGEVGGLLDGKTYVPRPSGGHQTIISRYFRTPLAKGGWINVRVYSVKGTPFKVAYSLQADDTKWASWLASMKWDSAGEPSEAAPPVPQPDPGPGPDPAPTGKATIKVNGQQLIITLPAGVTWV